MAATTTLDTHSLHRQLLRPPVLDILRAAGFTRTRPAVLDTVVDLTSRYLTLLATHTAAHAQSRPSTENGEHQITITDIRKALQDVGALHPQLSELEELSRGEEDMRGIDAFLEWGRGDVNAEIRRIAGMSSACSSSAITGTTTAVETTGATNAAGGRRQSTAAAVTAAVEVEAEALLAAEGREDYLTALKKKHSKTGEESRWQGTVLGKDGGEREVVIEGWEVGDINGWRRRLKMTGMGQGGRRDEEGLGEAESGSSSPLSEMTGSGLDSGFG